MAGDANRLRRLVATDRLILGADKAIQTVTHGIGQHADAGNAPGRSFALLHFPNGQMS